MDEGYYENYLDYTSIKSDDRDPEMFRRLRKAGISILLPGANVELRNIRARGYDECYIFSLSEGKFLKLKAAMCAKDSNIGYSAAVKLEHLESLSENIMNQGMFCPFHDEAAPTQKVSDYFSNIERSRVAYKSFRSEFSDPDFGMIEPRYTKDPIFSNQCEFRFTLMPCSDSLPDRISIHVPNAHRFFSKVFSDSQQPSSTDIRAKSSLPELIHRLKSIKIGESNEINLANSPVVVDEIISICWEARKIGHRIYGLEDIVIRKDIVYYSKLTSSMILDVISEVKKGLVLLEEAYKTTNPD